MSEGRRGGPSRRSTRGARRGRSTGCARERGVRARREEVPDALGAVEALLTALKEATPARRRRLAAKVARLLASEATK